MRTNTAGAPQGQRDDSTEFQFKFQIGSCQLFACGCLQKLGVGAKDGWVHSRKYFSWKFFLFSDERKKGGCSATHHRVLLDAREENSTTFSRNLNGVLSFLSLLRQKIVRMFYFPHDASARFANRPSSALSYHPLFPPSSSSSSFFANPPPPLSFLLP